MTRSGPHPEPAAAPVGTGSRFGVALRIVALAVAMGGLVGLGEVALLSLAFSSGVLVRMGPDFPWLVPTAEMLLFAGVGGSAALASLRWRGRRLRAAVAATLTGLATLVVGFFFEAIHPLAVVVLAAGVGTQAARMAHGSAARRVARWAPAAAAAAVVLTVGLGLQARAGAARAETARLGALPAPPTGDAPNVLLVILDTVRATALGHLGALGDPTPTADRLAEEGVHFTAAIAPAPWTLPSHASIFTGRWPGELSAGWDSPLDGTTPTLAEALGARGYLTGGFTANLLNTARHTGLQRGFVHWRDYRVSAGELVLASALGRELAFNDTFRSLIGHHELLNRKPAPVVNRELLAWLDELGADRPSGDDRPWFAFVNYFDAHEPHRPEAPPTPAKWNDFVHRGGLIQGTNAWLREKWRMSATDVATHRDSYDDAVRRADRALGDLVAALEARGALDNTVVIVAADHGEQLGERGIFEHHTALYMPALHVPLVVWAPGRVPAGRRIARAVSLRDLAATILDLVPAEGPVLPGASLAALWRPDELERGVETSPAAAHLESVFTEQPGVPSALGDVMTSLVELPWQYIRNGDGSEEFYDLRRGVLEGPNLAGTAADSALRRVRGVLYRLSTGDEPPAELPITPRRLPDG